MHLSNLLNHKQSITLGLYSELKTLLLPNGDPASHGA